jgi:hypothetical protein
MTATKRAACPARSTRNAGERSTHATRRRTTCVRRGGVVAPGYGAASSLSSSAWRLRSLRRASCCGGSLRFAVGHATRRTRRIGGNCCRRAGFPFVIRGSIGRPSDRQRPTWSPRAPATRTAWTFDSRRALGRTLRCTPLGKGSPPRSTASSPHPRPPAAPCITSCTPDNTGIGVGPSLVP